MVQPALHPGDVTVTLRNALERVGVRFRLGAGDPRKLHLCCPFCVERGRVADVGFRLCVHLTEGWGRCVHCDWKARRAAPLLLRKLRITADAGTGFIDEPEVRLTPSIKLPLDFHSFQPSDSWDRRALRYLIGRGITRKQIEECGLGVSYTGRYAYRIVFPVRERGALRGIVARDFTGRREPKYLFSSGPKHLYHFDPDTAVCVLSEGVFKALRIQHVTQYGSAALLGHGLAPEQLRQLRESKCRKVVIYPDPDPPGMRGAVAVADRLCEEWGGEVRVVWPVRLPADEDVLSGLRQGLLSARVYGWALRQKIFLCNSVGDTI